MHALDERVGREEERAAAADASAAGIVARADANAGRRSAGQGADETADPARARPSRSRVASDRAAARQPSMDFTLSRKLFDIG